MCVDERRLLSCGLTLMVGERRDNRWQVWLLHPKHRCVASLIRSFKQREQAEQFASSCDKRNSNVLLRYFYRERRWRED